MLTKMLIITPIYQRPGSGASTYYNLLYKWLDEHDYRCEIISEWPPSRTVKYGIWPVRSGRAKSWLRDICLYGVQNILYLLLPAILLWERPKKIIVHSSFFNNPNTLILVIGVFLFFQRKFAKSFVIDCRDSGFSKLCIKFLNYFSVQFIACSLNVESALIEAGADKELVQYIPIPHQGGPEKKEFRDEILAKFNLKSRQYVAYAGLIKTEKKVDVLVQAFKKYRKMGGKIPVLVLAGLMKDSGALRDSILSDPCIRHIGNLSPKEVRGLYRGSALAINVSPIEGMPRSSLEAITQEVPVILPPNVPEFANSDPNLIAPLVVEELSTLMLLQEKEQRRARYCIDQHEISAVFGKYQYVLS